MGRFNGRIREDFFGDGKAARTKKLKLAIYCFLKEVAAFVVTGRIRPSPAEIAFVETVLLENAICRRLRECGVSCKESVFRVSMRYLVFLEWRDFVFEESIRECRRFLGSDKESLPMILAMSFVEPGMLSQFCVDGLYENRSLENNMLKSMWDVILDATWRCSSKEELGFRLSAAGYLG